MTLYLVDGHALAYRSYFAFAANPLTNSRGEETSAVYGFVNTLLTLIREWKPDALAVVFDPEGPTFRHEQFAEYKAHREETPESLVEQMRVIRAVLEAMGLPEITVDGFEADDVIATLARRWRDRCDVRIVSGDKDLFQLIDDRVRLIRPGRGRVLEGEMDAEGLREKLGIAPSQVVDYLALTGDASDNVPGVRGIGPKTAAKLLQTWGSLDAVYEHLDEVTPPGVRRKLEAGREAAMASRELVRLRDDVPVGVELEQLALPDVRTDAFREVLERLEFHRFARQLFDAPGEAGAGDARRGRADVAGERFEATRDEREDAARNTRAGEAGARARPGAEPAAGEAPGDAATRARADSADAGAGVGADYACVDTREALEALAERLRACERIAVDTETSSPLPMHAVLAGISLSDRPGRAWYVPVTSELAAAEGELLPARRAPGLEPEVVREVLGPVLAADRPRKVGQNIKYDEIVLERAGLPLGGVEFDTMIASYCLDPARRSHSLDALARELCGHEMIPFASLFERRSARRDIREAPLERVTEYACEDADYTLRIHDVLAPMIEASTVRDLFHHVEMPLREVLRRMEMTGIRVDREFLEALSQRYRARIAELEAEIHREVGGEFNINSTQQLREVLFDRLGLKPSRRTRTGYSTDADVLAGLAGEHPVIDRLLEYRRLVKLQGTYVDALPRLIHPETGRVHTSFNQAVASTGRLSSSDPNLQNIPIRTEEGREIRRAFVAEPGWVLIDADYSQIELRILAHLSGDAALREAFACDADIHRMTAARVMGVDPDRVDDEMRSRAKAVNFGIIYGMGARGLARSLGIGVDEARRFIDDYFASYPGVKRFIDDTIRRARDEKAAWTMLGRVRRLPDIDSTNGRARSFAERVAVNTPVQGTAADIIKLAMLEVDRALADRGLRARMLLQVHDELLLEAPEDEAEAACALVRECMEGAVTLEVPLRVDVGTGRTWLDAH